MRECVFEQLFIMTKAVCSTIIDNESVVLAAKIQMNEESYLNCEILIGDFVLTKELLSNVRITETPAANFKWVKK